MTKSQERSFQVLLFASLRDQAGWTKQRVMLPDQDLVTAEDVWSQLQLGTRPASVQIAINRELVSPQTLVHAGDEVAFLPPFTGG